jgi:F-type H+-transporting ATPase subunit delta
VQPVAVAKRYARALADHVEMKPGGAGVSARKDAASLEATASELELIVRVLGADPKFGRFFSDPSIPQKNKQAAMEALARKAKLSEAMRNFLMVLVINRRLGALASIRQSFEEIKDERGGLVQAETATAVPLSAAELKRLREALETITGRKVRIAHRVDPALLGGARTRIGSRVYDGTLRHQLEVLRERLAGAH